MGEDEKGEVKRDIVELAVHKRLVGGRNQGCCG